MSTSLPLPWIGLLADECHAQENDKVLPCPYGSVCHAHSLFFASIIIVVVVLGVWFVVLLVTLICLADSVFRVDVKL